jgi:sortase (surface protein transpeptidase)
MLPGGRYGGRAMRRRSPVAVAGLTLGLVLPGCGTAEDQAVERAPRARAETSSQRTQERAPATRGTRARKRAHPTAGPGAPRRIVIPAIAVDAKVIRLGLDAEGALETPQRFEQAGWWSGGPRPGRDGPAVIAGHVDSRSGPAVFFRLGELPRGSSIRVIDHRGRAHDFRVRRTERHPKDRFPTDRVYRQASGAELRLVTCSGTFDTSTGHYRDNTIVFATAA